VTLGARAFRRDQFLVRQRLSFDKPQERVAKQIDVGPVIEAPCDLIEVRRQMLHRKLMVRADNRAVEEAPDALNRVRVNVAPNPLFRRVVNPLMARVFVAASTIGAVGVCVDRLGVGRDELSEVYVAAARSTSPRE
jgi:hypothetical protein